MSTSARPPNGRPSDRPWIVDRALELDRGWWATIVGLVILAMAWAIP